MNKMDFIRPDLPSKCTWDKNADLTTSPHTLVPYGPKQKILPHVLEAIGNTPLIKLNHIPKSEGIRCEMRISTDNCVVVPLGQPNEYELVRRPTNITSLTTMYGGGVGVIGKMRIFNPGGSVKDRIGYRMVEDAEKKGLLKPGYTIIEPTSGNTGIGLAMASAVKGYRCIIVMPLKMSNEKVDILHALGAEIVRTPTEAAFDSPEGLIAVSQKIQRETPNSIVLDQYRNPGNPLAHYDLTATEIYDQCDGKIDMVVLGAGTGGTVTGVGRKLKELCPTCIIVGVDPKGSILAEPEHLNKSDTTFYEVEGIGYDFIPTVLDRSVVDVWVKSNDKESLPMARRLIREEGLLCGGSSGTALVAGIQAAASLQENQRCVVILPDGVRNYMTKFVSDQWMEARNLRPCVNTNNHWWWDKEIDMLNMKAPMTVMEDVSCSMALTIMKKQGYGQLPVLNVDQGLVGMVTISNITNLLINCKIELNDPVKKAIMKQFRILKLDSKLGLASRILEKEAFVLVVDKPLANKANAVHDKSGEKVLGIITNEDLLQFITQSKENGFVDEVNSKAAPTNDHGICKLGRNCV